jgi:hypothetical protein
LSLFLQEEKGRRTGGVGLTYLMLIDFDRNHDNKISIDEWNEGFQAQKEGQQEEAEEEAEERAALPVVVG